MFLVIGSPSVQVHGIVFGSLHVYLGLQTGALAGRQGTESVSILITVVRGEDLALVIFVIVEPVIALHHRFGETGKSRGIWLFKAIILNHIIVAIDIVGISLHSLLLIGIPTSKGSARCKTRGSVIIVSVLVVIVRIEVIVAGSIAHKLVIAVAICRRKALVITTHIVRWIIRRSLRIFYLIER